MQYDKGYVSPYMVSDRDKMQVEMDSPLVLVTNHKIHKLTRNSTCTRTSRSSQ